MNAIKNRETRHGPRRKIGKMDKTPGATGNARVMQLALEAISKKVGAQTWLYQMDLAPQGGAVTVLLGATQAGKTSLLRIMAGLDRPGTGRVLVDGCDVTGIPVRRRNVAMVYQQFINYPAMTVAANIASPLRLRGAKNIEARVREIAARLHIGNLLNRYPAELSGGQQQRVALARALAKGAPLMLLDEPLQNLDYKLREELREELAALFATGQSSVVYATTDPAEALLLGGHTALLAAGRLLQYGPTAEVFHAPVSLQAARAFSDPPMNLLAVTAGAQGLRLEGGAQLPPALLPQQLQMPLAATGALTLGLRASALRVHARPGDVRVDGVVALAEISGSDTFVHASTPWGDLVAQLTGVHYLEPGAPIALHADPQQAYVFDSGGQLAHAPARRGTF